MSLISVLLSLAFVALLAACSPAVEPSTGPERQPAPEVQLREAIEVARVASGGVELAVRAEVDGVTEAEIVVAGTITDGGRGFDLDITGPTSLGAGTVGVRLVGGRFFQRGPVIAEAFPAARDRWVELGATDAAAATFGFVGPAGFVALDLVDDIDAVSSPSPGRFEGSLGEVVVDGGRIEHVDAATFGAVVTDGALTSLDVELASGTGVRLTVELRMHPVSEVAPVAMPDRSDVYTP